MTTIRKIVTSKVDGSDANNTTDDEIRPFGETAFYLDTSGPTDKLTLMMFDGVRTHRDSKVLSPGVLWGSDADAGDGSGADTIKLIPDATLYANGSDQYIVVDPTGGEPGHIHLRAGGTQDNSSADLYLGGELTCVRVSDTSDSVTIRTTNIGDPNITMNWTFDNQGNLYFPGIGNNRIGESEPGLVVSSDASVVLQSNNNGESNEWTFNTNGSITFPDATIQTTAYTGVADTLATVTARGATTTASVTVNELITADVTGATSPAVGFNIAGAPFPEGAGLNFTWTWVSNGPAVQQLIAQGNSLIGAQVTQSEFAGTATVIGLPNLGGTLGIELDAAITYSETNTLTFTSPNYAPPTPLPINVSVNENTWTFTTNGGLIFPDGTTQTTAAFVQGVFTFDMDGTNTTATISSITGNLLIVRPAIGYLGSDTHTVTLPAGVGGQRLVIANYSNLCNFVVDQAEGSFTIAPQAKAEFIYDDTVDNMWIPLYGVV